MRYIFRPGLFYYDKDYRKGNAYSFGQNVLRQTTKQYLSSFPIILKNRETVAKLNDYFPPPLIQFCLG